MFGLGDNYAYKVDMMKNHGNVMASFIKLLLKEADDDERDAMQQLLDNWEWAKAINPFEED